MVGKLIEAYKFNKTALLKLMEYSFNKQINSFNKQIIKTMIKSYLDFLLANKHPHLNLLRNHKIK